MDSYCLWLTEQPSKFRKNLGFVDFGFSNNPPKLPIDHAYMDGWNEAKMMFENPLRAKFFISNTDGNH